MKVLLEHLDWGLGTKDPAFRLSTGHAVTKLNNKMCFFNVFAFDRIIKCKCFFRQPRPTRKLTKEGKKYKNLNFLKMKSYFAR